MQKLRVKTKPIENESSEKSNQAVEAIRTTKNNALRSNCIEKQQQTTTTKQNKTTTTTTTTTTTPTPTTTTQMDTTQEAAFSVDPAPQHHVRGLWLISPHSKAKQSLAFGWVGYKLT